MIITEITRQEKDKNRCSIFIEDRFFMGIYEDTLVKFRLRKGDEVTEQAIKEIKLYDEINFGKKTALKYLAYKPRSKKEIEKKLTALKLSENSIKEVINWLENIRYLNDDHYSKLLIESKTIRKPIGRRLLIQKLLQSGIEKETIEKNILELYPGEKEQKAAVTVLKKYSKKVKAKNETERKRKCFQYLLSRGFEYGVVTEAMKELETKIPSEK
ncbi:MAG TPA: RecX family transcriptional regulator [Ignavibacteria bacterium]|nr:RecX family transcriptional regulator [Ignavibacteria bacterium]